ncbi:Transposase InsO and inactivated derivatives [Clostridium sp. DSM 8431]|nr:Transposase InsO and inactivated derivatives [Clostridium sp. DSM 8431]
MCEVLGVARSSFYKTLNKSELPRAKENEKLKEIINKIYHDNKGRYGSPKIQQIMIKEGYVISEKNVQKLMRQMNLYAITIKKYKHHSSKNVVNGLENVLKRDFSTTTINEKWVGDITYIHTLKDGWTYLASVLDLHSKKIIGYAYGKSMNNALVVEALTNAYNLQKPSNNVIFHTVLGSQYTSNEMKELCSKLNIKQSFSKKGCPYDNACIESFHAALKKEEVYTTKYSDYSCARIAIFKYIEGFCITEKEFIQH